MQKVVTAALLRDGQVLLVHRSPHRHAYPDVWDLPGGHVEAGESELDALAREIDEELGVRIVDSTASPLCRLAVHGEKEAVTVSVWVVTDWSGTPTNLAPDEHDAMRWFPPDEMPPLAHLRLRPALLALLLS